MDMNDDDIIDLAMMYDDTMTPEQRLELCIKSYNRIMDDYKDDVNSLELSFTLGVLVSSIMEDDEDYFEDEEGLLHDDCNAAKFLFALDDALINEDEDEFKKLLKDRLLIEEKYEYIIALKL